MTIRVEDYFKPVNKNLDRHEKNMVIALRNEINDLRTVGEQYDFVKTRRQDPAALEFDRRVFGFSKQAVIFDPNAIERNRLNEYYKNICDEVEFEDEFSKQKRKRFKKKVYITIFCSIFGAIFSLFQTVNKYGGLLGATTFFRHTPFRICTVDLENSSPTYTKSLVDDKGITRYIPGNGWDYSGYEQQREDIINGIVPDEDHPLIAFTSEMYSGLEESRGVGTFRKLGKTNSKSTIDPQSDYVIVMRWEYMPFYIEMPDGEEQRPSRYPNADSVSFASDVGLAVIDQDYKDWLAKQKFIIFNPTNHKSVICEPGDGTKDVLWGGKNVQPLGLLSGPAIEDLDYDVDSGIELEVYFVPPELGDISTGMVTPQMDLTSDGCNISFGIGVGNVLPGVTGGNPDADVSGINNGIVSTGSGDSWMDTITPEYKALLQKYGFWPDKDMCTACASYSSIMLCERYGDITPTASTANLLNQLINNPNYINLGMYKDNHEGLVAGTVLIRKPGNGYEFGHTGIYAGAGGTGVEGKDFISASLGSRGPKPNRKLYGQDTMYMFVRK